MLEFEGWFYLFFKVFKFGLLAFVPIFIGIVFNIIFNSKKVLNRESHTSFFYNGRCIASALVDPLKYDDWIPIRIFATLCYVAPVLLLVAALLYASVNKLYYTDDVELYNNNASTIKEYLDIEHPTKKDCEKAEEYNESIKNANYLSKEYKADNSHYVDTELLWAKFCNNVETRRLEYIVR